MKPPRNDYKSAPAADANGPQQRLDGVAAKPEKAKACTEGDEGTTKVVLARWLKALHCESRDLPQPIAVAMTEGAMRGPLGQSLCQIESSLMGIESASLDYLTGSEVRVLTAVLHALTESVTRLEGEITQLYTAQTH